MSVFTKICGLSTFDTVAAATDAGADMLGFVFYPPSPRNLPAAAAADLVAAVPSGIDRVGLFVDADDALLRSVLERVPLDILQLHGSETPERVAEIRDRFRRPVMKAVKVAEAADLDRAAAYDNLADWLLFDAKPPKTVAGALPGGNGLAFDWTLLAGRRYSRPWMLSGGLEASNLAEAVRSSGAVAVDVSSGVESAPGRKDPERIRRFLDAARRL